MLPLEIIEQAAAELTNYHGCGMSVMEMSHRSQVFQDIIDTAEADLRDLMNIPEGYREAEHFSSPWYRSTCSETQRKLITSLRASGLRKPVRKLRNSVISA